MGRFFLSVRILLGMGFLLGGESDESLARVEKRMG